MFLSMDQKYTERTDSDLWLHCLDTQNLGLKQLEEDFTAVPIF